MPAFQSKGVLVAITVPVSVRWLWLALDFFRKRMQLEMREEDVKCLATSLGEKRSISPSALRSSSEALPDLSSSTSIFNKPDLPSLRSTTGPVNIPDHYRTYHHPQNLQRLIFQSSQSQPVWFYHHIHGIYTHTHNVSTCTGMHMHSGVSEVHGAKNLRARLTRQMHDTIKKP